jgi:hypothetical protein
MKRWERKGRRGMWRLGEDRGYVLLFVLLIMFVLGMMLFAYGSLTRNEAGVAAFNRNSTVALSLAEAGISQELTRLNNTPSLPVPGTTVPIALASTVGGSGTVTYQASVSGALLPTYPLLSTATFAGTQRKIRVFVQANFKSGTGNIIMSPSEQANNSLAGVTGDLYAQTFFTVANPQAAPQCAAGDTATNLLAPQVMAGTYISMGGGNPLCGLSESNSSTFVTECADGSTSEVAPTACAADGGRDVVNSDTLPYNQHPMTPSGMPSPDFTTLVTWVAANPALASTYGLSMVQATQGGAGVAYTPVGYYTPSYWGGAVPSGHVELVVAAEPFCVSSSTGSVTLPTPAVSGTCAPGYIYYGNQVSGAAHTMRFLDWGLVTDDLARTQPTTFFQAPQCTGCGNQNGIRYIPFIPPLWTNSTQFAALACRQNVNPGTNVFDNVIADGISCPNPPITTHTNVTSETFTGTQATPESLVIDNAGGNTVVFGPDAAHTPSTVNCSSFTSYNYGLILATGNIQINSKMVFTGYIYTMGNFQTNNAAAFNGGVYAASIQGQSPPVNSATVNNDSFCGGQSIPVQISGLFLTFAGASWQDVPLNEP